jgi:hypothetical protein
MDASFAYVVALAGVFVGIFLRTVWPWLQVRASGTAGQFDVRYLVSAVLAFFAALATLDPVIAVWLASDWSAWSLFAAAVVWGLAVNEGTNRVADRGL